MTEAVLRTKDLPLRPLTGVESAKRAAAFHAVSQHLSPEATKVGIGSGSTVVYVVEKLQRLPKERTKNITFYPTGFQSRELIVGAGLKLGDVADLRDGELDVCFDGADEVDDRLNCIKGGGACLMLEKLVAVCSGVFVVVADYRKLSNSLLSQYPRIPVEIIPQSLSYVKSKIHALGGVPNMRLGGTAKAGPCVTDNGNLILDVDFPHGATVDGVRLKRTADGKDIKGLGLSTEEVALRLKAIVGVLEHGIFWEGDKKPVVAYFGMEDGGVTMRKKGLPDTPIAASEIKM
ncbi:ribose 5-phosphate isomerase [Ascobolus immersus RN42]|uniref:Ribose-5-phosphate isomerase n=1 Tax=Ascobolus immersus RN42 TaxID=1160509 RepID=A0A3N4IBW6_ASCIM|nr:ribose 5-phosphate isomerase [Ascobolus immersus RN42]